MRCAASWRSFDTACPGCISETRYVVSPNNFLMIWLMRQRQLAWASTKLGNLEESIDITSSDLRVGTSFTMAHGSKIRWRIKAE